ncbi:hypothetical protein TPHA_0G00750 [Tetrapisispora phaffii CBS 4417]|uniref:Tubulin-specific chaperone A n=1 Tax=Tetrapisispora phaffii (strain ATCC 24235 / CBS 4417 / NBRC 1672 / NRRL Y-8282 / UCD 70-5) TaxID=1071381 RepID=G8BVI3_TETPH|nr:hypothetical protein TPHA_0G00750 [Tetrapisispora phaffii CBS 4417]CCE63911.1 hypothetical protein TPHA_0G00750 [Tetrapisispora phaffii CBS 4417]
MAPTQLEIKVKALQRLVKEETFYQQELVEQSEHVEKMKSDASTDPYDLKKQVEVLEDTQRLFPTLYKKIGEFKDNLQEFIDKYEGSESLDSAKEALKSATELLNSKK